MIPNSSMLNYGNWIRIKAAISVIVIVVPGLTPTPPVSRLPMRMGTLMKRPLLNAASYRRCN
jgi:hypothetical protein